MAQCVMEFTTDSVETALALLDELVAPKKAVETLSCAEQDTLRFRASKSKLRMLLRDLMSGRLCSVMLKSEGDIRYGLLTCPRFNGQDLSVWMGTIEFRTEAWRSTWKELLTNGAVRIACVGMEEGINLTDSFLAVYSFPWHDPSLIAGAPRRSDGPW